MKKLLTLFMASCLLAGCSGGGKKPEVVKCSGEMEGMQAIVELTFLEEKLTDLGMEMSLEAPDEATAKVIVGLKDELKKELGFEEISNFDVSNVGKFLTIKVNMSVEEAKKLEGVTSADFNETKSKIIEDIEEDGLKCK